MPIIPAIVASGLPMGLLDGLGKAVPTLSSSGLFQIISLFANAAFVFLPILIAVSAAKVFGGNPFLGAVIGMIMIHPNLVNAWSVADLVASGAAIPSASAWFGLYQVDLVGYQGHVIPIVIAVLLMSTLEKWLHRVVPAVIDLFVTPLVTVLVTGYVTLTIVGPIFTFVENWVLTGAKMLIGVPFGIGAALVGGLYAPTVVAGVHHMYNAIEAGLLAAKDNGNIWMPIATAANVAQGAAALAVAIRSRQEKIKKVALPASLSAFLGITEPAIFGVNIRYGKPFIAGCIGGAAGGLTAGVLSVSASAYGITGVFGVLITTHNIWQYLLSMGVAFVVAFFACQFIYREPGPVSDFGAADGAAPDADGAAPGAAGPNAARGSAVSAGGDAPLMPARPAVKEAAALPGTMYSPFNGTTMALSAVPDETFASGVLGQGIGFLPADGTVYAPCDATVSMVYDTRHALGLETADGMELLIHIGINTVELDGKGFEICCREHDAVKTGDVLATFDMAAIGAAGYRLETPLIVTNSDDFAGVEVLRDGPVRAGDPVLRIRRTAD